MRRFKFQSSFGLRVFLFFAVATLVGGALAQSNSPQLESMLRKTLNAVRSGSPNYGDMEPMLADQVEQQLASMRQRFTALGSIQAIEFKGIQSTPSGPAEYYRVRFENGQMSWMINLTPAKKIGVLWAPG